MALQGAKAQTRQRRAKGPWPVKTWTLQWAGNPVRLILFGPMVLLRYGAWLGIGSAGPGSRDGYDALNGGTGYFSFMDGENHEDFGIHYSRALDFDEEFRLQAFFELGDWFAKDNCRSIDLKDVRAIYAKRDPSPLGVKHWTSIAQMLLAFLLASSGIFFFAEGVMDWFSVWIAPTFSTACSNLLYEYPRAAAMLLVVSAFGTKSLLVLVVGFLWMAGFLFWMHALPMMTVGGSLIAVAVWLFLCLPPSREYNLAIVSPYETIRVLATRKEAQELLEAIRSVRPEIPFHAEEEVPDKIFLAPDLFEFAWSSPDRAKTWEEWHFRSGTRRTNVIAVRNHMACMDGVYRMTSGENSDNIEQGTMESCTFDVRDVRALRIEERPHSLAALLGWILALLPLWYVFLTLFHSFQEPVAQWEIYGHFSFFLVAIGIGFVCCRIWDAIQDVRHEYVLTIELPDGTVTVKCRSRIDELVDAAHYIRHRNPACQVDVPKELLPHH